MNKYQENQKGGSPEEKFQEQRDNKIPNDKSRRGSL